LDTEARKAAIGRLTPYITTLQAALGLAHWHIIIYDDPHPYKPDVVAVVDPGEGQNLGELWLNDGALAEESEDLRDTIVHELLHLHQGHVLHAVDSLSREFGATAWNLWEAGFRRELEYMTDALARVIAPHLPLPPAEETP
jgi:hypothetical protein